MLLTTPPERPPPPLIFFFCLRLKSLILPGFRVSTFTRPLLLFFFAAFFLLLATITLVSFLESEKPYTDSSRLHLCSALFSGRIRMSLICPSVLVLQVPVSRLHLCLALFSGRIVMSLIYPSVLVSQVSTRSVTYYATRDTAAALDLLLLTTSQILDRLALQVKHLHSALTAFFLCRLLFTLSNHYLGFLSCLK